MENNYLEYKHRAHWIGCSFLNIGIVQADPAVVSQIKKENKSENPNLLTSILSRV